MAIEIEAKILKINKEALEKKLIEIGAKKIEDIFFRSISFDFNGYPLDVENSWIRLRDNGKKVTLAYKKRLGVTSSNGDDAGMEEIEVSVSNYEDTALLLKRIGMIEKFSQEKKRTTWKKGNVTFDIDTWPKLDTYLEIEANSWEEVDKAILDLGYRLEDKMICSTTQIYAMNGVNDKDYSKMTFTEWIKR